MTTLPPIYFTGLTSESGTSMPDVGRPNERSVLIYTPEPGIVGTVVHAEVNVHSGGTSPPTGQAWIWSRRLPDTQVPPRWLGGGDGPVFARSKPSAPSVQNNNCAMSVTGESTSPQGTDTRAAYAIVTEFEELKANFCLSPGSASVAPDTCDVFVIIREETA